MLNNFPAEAFTFSSDELSLDIYDVLLGLIDEGNPCRLWRSLRLLLSLIFLYFTSLVARGSMSLNSIVFAFSEPEILGLKVGLGSAFAMT